MINIPFFTKRRKRDAAGSHCKGCNSHFLLRDDGSALCVKCSTELEKSINRIGEVGGMSVAAGGIQQSMTPEEISLYEGSRAITQEEISAIDWVEIEKNRIFFKVIKDIFG